MNSVNLEEVETRNQGETEEVFAENQLNIADKSQTQNLRSTKYIITYDGVLPNDVDESVVSNASTTKYSISKRLLDSMGGLYGKLHCDWVKVIEIIEENPAEAKGEDWFGNIPLHLASEKAAIPLAVATLLDAHPQGARSKNLRGQLPIHCASKNSECQLSVISLLLKYFPEGAREYDSNGCLPLHLAISSNAPIEVQDLLFKAYPNGKIQGRRANAKVFLQQLSSRLKLREAANLAAKLRREEGIAKRKAKMSKKKKTKQRK